MLNIYKKSYKLAIELHQLLNEENGLTLKEEFSTPLKESARDILANLVEAQGAKTKKAKRFYNFKALDVVRRIFLDLEFLADTYALLPVPCEKLIAGYKEVARDIYKMNEELLKTK